MLRCTNKLRFAVYRNAVKAVIFDMGGVVLPSPTPAIMKFEVENNIPGGTVMAALKKNGEASLWCSLERGEISVGDFEKRFGQELEEFSGQPCNTNGLITAIEKMLATPIQDTLDTIHRLRELNIPVALLTNNWFVDKDETCLHELLKDQFDVIVESARFGERKPQFSIYNEVLRQLDLPAEETVFLDDIGANLKAAKSLGIKTIKVSGGHPQSAIHELQNLIGEKLVSWPRGSTPIRDGMNLNRQKLKTYLESVCMLTGDEIELRQFDHGQSNPTYYVRFGGREMVLRKKPPGKLLRGAHMIEREYKVMQKLNEAGVPTPKTIILCEDDSVCGTAFYIMDYIHGRVFKNASLSDVPNVERREIYLAAVEALAKIHKCDPVKIGLEDFGKLDGYLARQIRTWTKQYRAAEIDKCDEMEELVNWLPENLKKQVLPTAVAHGDFRIDNCIFHPTENKVIAILDWELSTLGDPISDLSYMCMPHHLPSTAPLIPGIADIDLKEAGIPPTLELVNHYCKVREIDVEPDLDYYTAFGFFRLAAICQGVYARALKGQASNHNLAMQAGAMVPIIASQALKFARRSDRRVTQTRSMHTQQFITNPNQLRDYAKRIYDDVTEFVQEEVIPREHLYAEHESNSDTRWTVMPEMEELKNKSKDAGLWNIFLPIEADPEQKYGKGLTNLEYSFMAEQMGRSIMGSEPFNCSPPDTGNMEVLIKYGTAEQQREWLTPLLEGKTRSCFGMTEPRVASSDATNIESSIERDGDEYVVNGRKWWTSMAMHPNCEICIFMGKTRFDGPKHRQQSMILVPMRSEGVNIIRPLTAYGHFDGPGGHAELEFNNVRVPASNILVGEGEGFAIAQGRLGPGRIHHCMRLIGHAERSLELMKKRLSERIAFGKPLIQHGSWKEKIGLSRIEIEQARLMTLLAAHKMDTIGNKEAAREIAMIKVIAPRMAEKVIDQSIQAHGGGGISSDFPMAGMMAWARILRLADGPDEVHIRAISRLEMKN